jgi:hypothetical protein
MGRVAFQTRDHKTLTGSVGAKFIINVKGSFSMSGGSSIRVGTGVHPQDVIYDIIGPGANVTLNGGSAVDGSLLVPMRGVSFSIGTSRGQVISGGNVVIQSGARIQCPHCPNP